MTHVFAGIPTANYSSAVRWYERFLGRPPDRFPKDEEAVWQLTDTGLVYLVGDADRLGRATRCAEVTALRARTAGRARAAAPRGLRIPQRSVARVREEGPMAM
jgi:hypothetical protein